MADRWDPWGANRQQSVNGLVTSRRLAPWAEGDGNPQNNGNFHGIRGGASEVPNTKPQQAVYDPQTQANRQTWNTPYQAQQKAPVPAANPQGGLTTGTAQTQAAQTPNPQNGYTSPGPQPTTPNTAGHPFFDPSHPYGNVPQGSTQFDPQSLAFMNWATNENPEGYYFALLNSMGLGGFDARSQAAQAMYRDFARGFGAAHTQNMELFFPQYMQMQNIPNILAGLSNEQLGIDNSGLQGRDRWALRGY